MKKLLFVSIALILFMGCEDPLPSQSETLIYRGATVVEQPAPFLTQNRLAKDDKGEVVIQEVSADVTVYGLLDDVTVYLAVGGEQLPSGTWVGSLDNEPVTVSLTDEVDVIFESLTSLTVIDADNIVYLNADGIAMAFSGSGVIIASAISTGINGFATLVTTVQFSVGGDGCDPQ